MYILKQKKINELLLLSHAVEIFTVLRLFGSWIPTESTVRSAVRSFFLVFTSGG